eukprot:TRINITY_DN15323_c0_g1_i1.p1 TRINITY_DN15323_c0_g1~~TRINITY_DN15323_c0_g1_i1.p1  ORF type:complete len:207 (-),score=24.88 TRINITY_DN15323_c0_g1_i1:170-730(-)
MGNCQPNLRSICGRVRDKSGVELHERSGLLGEDSDYGVEEPPRLFSNDEIQRLTMAKKQEPVFSLHDDQDLEDEMFNASVHAALTPGPEHSTPARSRPSIPSLAPLPILPVDVSSPVDMDEVEPTMTADQMEAYWDKADHDHSAISHDGDRVVTFDTDDDVLARGIRAATTNPVATTNDLQIIEDF